MAKVEITVLRKLYHADLAAAFLVDGAEAGSCPLLQEGQQFVYEGSAVMPAGFCPWAWADIYKTVSAISAGASYDSWYSRKHFSVDCCTDGIRPVIFRIAAVGGDTQ
jgi:uncharacterized repeat protein (TIGR04076 family)